MQGCEWSRRLLLAIGLVITCCTTGYAEEPRKSSKPPRASTSPRELAGSSSRQTNHDGGVPSAWRDDASLHQVQWVGSRNAYAVGGQGAFWKTTDGGRTWQQVSTGVCHTLTSLCFLMDQVGWVAGSESGAYAGLESGVVLSTEDGGQTWTRLGKDQLPPLSAIKFFNLEEGIAIGQGTSDVPSGVLRTNDGGKTWQPLNGTTVTSWRAASMIAPELGVVAGPEGRLSLIGGDNLLASKLPPQGLRAIRAVSIQADDTGWLAGDGGLVLTTTSGGVVWDSPETPLPEELRQGIDFRALDVRGNKVWLAGSPGGVVWHSPNAGKDWRRFLTGQPTPINSIRFSDDSQGIAVGELGVILRTEDGGRSWQAVRGGDRRVALMTISSRPSQVSPALLAKLSGEEGYRSVSWVASRQDIGPTASSTDMESRLQSAVDQVGGNSAELHWQLPVSIPGLEFAPDKLIADWQKRTEGKLGPFVLGLLVRQLRTWRPTIVVVDQPGKDDAASQLMLDAVLRAIDQAADSSRYIEQREFCGLGSWKVERIYLQSSSGVAGDAKIELDEYLPRRRMSVRVAASSSDALLRLNTRSSEAHLESRQITYRRIGTDGRPVQESTTARDFFAGLSVTPGSESRRELAMINDSDLERMQKLAQRHRNYHAIAQTSFDDPRMAGQMIGQLNTIVRDMEPRQGAEVLRSLADEYRERSLYDLVEATNVELIRKYPQEPAAVDAMRWLFQFWTSSETAWQRTRQMNNDTARSSGNQPPNSRLIQQAANVLSQGVGGVSTADFADERPAIESVTRPGRLNKFKLPSDLMDADRKGNKAPQQLPSQEWRSGEILEWHKRATDLASQLELQSPLLFRSPEIQFPLAALRRSTGSMGKSDTIYRGFLSRAVDAMTRSLAEREVWMMFATAETPRGMHRCQSTSEKPRLDGVLSDSCWLAARELKLTTNPVTDEGPQEDDPIAALVMLAYDSEFLYVGLSVPRSPDALLDKPQPSGRTHDADLSRHDRVTICLDVDRDYATWYEFQVDQRGWTFESCWEDRRWNPKWYAATDADETHWRIEAAVPWDELTPTPPRPGHAWGVAITRTIPTVGVQSWVHPAMARPKPGSFGLLRFE